MIDTLRWVLVAASVCACSGRIETPPAASEPAQPPPHAESDPAPSDPVAVEEGGLVLTLSSAQASYARDSDAVLDTVIENRGNKTVQVRSEVVGNAIYMVDVLDASGRRVPTVPPSIPDGTKATFAPGATSSHTLSLGMFSPPLAAGDYTVRPSAPIFRGNTLTIHIGP